MLVFLKKYTDLTVAKKAILNEYSARSGKVCAIEYSESGKPYVIADGQQCSCVSISHTDGVLAMAFSQREVGVDIERADRKIKIKQCPDIESWTRIEAYCKMLGVGLSKSMLTSPIPDKGTSTRRVGEYVMSVCSEDESVEIVTLIDNICEE